jgi:hypothetical protein
MGIYIAVGLHVTWLGQNVAGYRKRSTSEHDVADGREEGQGHEDPVPDRVFVGDDGADEIGDRSDWGQLMQLATTHQNRRAR